MNESFSHIGTLIPSLKHLLVSFHLTPVISTSLWCLFAALQVHWDKSTLCSQQFLRGNMPEPDRILRQTTQNPIHQQVCEKIKHWAHTHIYMYIFHSYFPTKKEVTELCILKPVITWLLWNNNMTSGHFWLLQTSRHVEYPCSHEYYTRD